METEVIAALITAASVVSAALIGFLAGKKRESGSPIDKPSNVIKTLANIGSIEDFVEGSSEVFMSGVTLATRTNMLLEKYKSMLGKGCNFQFIVLDPESSVLPKLAMGQGKSAETLQKEINMALGMFQDLKIHAEIHRTAGKIEFFTFDYVPTLTLMRVKKTDSGEVIINVELPAYRTDIWKRPAFRVAYVDKELFVCFDQVCSRLWKDASSQQKAPVTTL